MKTEKITIASISTDRLSSVKRQIAKNKLKSADVLLNLSSTVENSVSADPTKGLHKSIIFMSVCFDVPAEKSSLIKGIIGVTQKCSAANCKCQDTTEIITLWGQGGTIFYCNNHLPEWAKSKKSGLKSPEKEMFGINKSWYQIV